MVKEIKICPNHQEHQVPMISTMIFRGSEAWCPFCGHDTGIFGDQIEVPRTKELVERGKYYERLSKEYRRAKAFYSASFMKYKGEMVKPQDLPIEVKKKFEQTALDYEKLIEKNYES